MHGFFTERKKTFFYVISNSKTHIHMCAAWLNNLKIYWTLNSMDIRGRFDEIDIIDINIR